MTIMIRNMKTLCGRNGAAAAGARILFSSAAGSGQRQRLRVRKRRRRALNTFGAGGGSQHRFRFHSRFIMYVAVIFDVLHGQSATFIRFRFRLHRLHQRKISTSEGLVIVMVEQNTGLITLEFVVVELFSKTLDALR
jgi:hypothetical protein